MAVYNGSKERYFARDLFPLLLLTLNLQYRLRGNSTDISHQKFRSDCGTTPYADRKSYPGRAEYPLDSASMHPQELHQHFLGGVEQKLIRAAFPTNLEFRE